MITYNTGDLFTSEAKALGHGVNCRGKMGAGIAYQFKQRFPEMYDTYRMLCEQGLLEPGHIYTYTGPDTVIINIASQQYPGPDARLSWLEEGVEMALTYCEHNQIPSLALPQIGCGLGGLQWDIVQGVLEAVSDRHPEIKLEIWSL